MSNILLCLITNLCIEISIRNGSLCKCLNLATIKLYLNVVFYQEYMYPFLYIYTETKFYQHHTQTSPYTIHSHKMEMAKYAHLYELVSISRRTTFKLQCQFCTVIWTTSIWLCLVWCRNYVTFEIVLIFLQIILKKKRNTIVLCLIYYSSTSQYEEIKVFQENMQMLR